MTRLARATHGSESGQFLSRRTAEVNASSDDERRRRVLETLADGVKAVHERLDPTREKVASGIQESQHRMRGIREVESARRTSDSSDRRRFARWPLSRGARRPVANGAPWRPRGLPLAGLALLVALGLGPLGCGSFIGYNVGAGIDGMRMEAVDPPYEESLAALPGEVVCLTTRDGRRYAGSLIDVPSRPERESSCVIVSRRDSALPGDFAVVDTIDVASIASARVAGHSRRFRRVGFVLGITADAALIYYVERVFGDLGEGGPQ